MKNLKVKMSVLALILGLGSAFATVKKVDENRKWSLDQSSGVYTDITGQHVGFDYECGDGSEVCTATYPAGQNPNLNSSNAIEVETGEFQ